MIADHENVQAAVETKPVSILSLAEGNTFAAVDEGFQKKVVLRRTRSSKFP